MDEITRSTSEIDPLALDFDSRIHRLARQLAEGVKSDQWSPLISVYTDQQGQRWSSRGHVNYENNLNDFLANEWRGMQPQATFLEAYGYFKRIATVFVENADSSNDNPWFGRVNLADYVRRNTVEYLLSEKAFELLEPSSGDTSVFISYRRNVSALQALLLSHWLHRKNVENFLDIENVDGGGPLQPYIVDAIKSRSHFICILGVVGTDENRQHTLQSNWVRKEIECALAENKICIAFLQHDWTPDYLTVEERELFNKLNVNKGVPTLPVADDTGLVKAYHLALQDLLPLLNKSRT